MGRYARKKMHKGDNPLKEKYRTRRKTKCLDQIHEDLAPEKADVLLNQPVDLDKPGKGQFYCLHCAKHFISEHALKSHFKGGQHKRRLKMLREAPYTTEEAERAAGMGSYHRPDQVEVTTQSTTVSKATATATDVDVNHPE